MRNAPATGQRVGVRLEIKARRSSTISVVQSVCQIDPRTRKFFSPSERHGLGSGGEITLRATSLWDVVPREIAMARAHKRCTYAGRVADHMVTQMLRQGDAEVFKLYSQAKLGMMREAPAKLDRLANERQGNSFTEKAG